MIYRITYNNTNPKYWELYEIDPSYYNGPFYDVSHYHNQQYDIFIMGDATDAQTAFVVGSRLIQDFIKDEEEENDIQN